MIQFLQLASGEWISAACVHGGLEGSSSLALLLELNTKPSLFSWVAFVKPYSGFFPCQVNY